MNDSIVLGHGKLNIRTFNSFQLLFTLDRYNLLREVVCVCNTVKASQFDC